MEVMDRVTEHYQEALKYFPDSRIIAVCLQGSQNYGLDTENSDVDTKLVITPTFEEIAMARKPISTTHIRENQEHIDFKDVRLMLQTFKKQNINFLEILFTEYQIVDPRYEYEWNRLRQAREAIAHYAPYHAVKTMKGVAMEKYHAMEHEYPSKLDILAVFGYDPKQLLHLLRVREFLYRYIAGERYEDCLRPRNTEFLKDVKRGIFNLEEARSLASAAIKDITETADKFYEKQDKDYYNKEIDDLINDVQLNLMREAIRDEFMPSAW